MSRAALAVAGAAITALVWWSLANGLGAGALPAYVAAGGVWAATLIALPRLPLARGDLWIVIALSIAIRLPAWSHTPTWSDDVARYRWDGRVQRAGLNPYDAPPDAPSLTWLRDDDWTHINNRELPTIYPPVAQLAFRAAAWLPHGWRALTAAADLALLALLVAWLRRRGDDARRALAWGWSPLAAIEIGADQHVDVLGIALLVAALASWERGRRAVAGALLGGAAAVKLVVAALLPSLRARRAWGGLALALALVTLPYAGAGARLTGSLGEYGRRWRANDGAFALVHLAASFAVAHSSFAAGRDLSPWLARAVTGRDRDGVNADEAANFLARALVAALYLGLLVWARRAPPLRFAEVAFGGWLLLTPTLHPWYVLWVVPLVAVGSSPAWMALAALVPLGHWPVAAYRTGVPWHDPIWTRAVEHGAAWLILACRALTAPVRAIRCGDLGEKKP